MTRTPAADPVLDLGSLDPVRPFLRIDGEDYRFRVDMDLNLVHLAKIERIRERIDQLDKVARKSKAQHANPDQAEEVSQALREGVDLVMYDEIPAAVMGKLNDIQRLAIVEGFTSATLRAASLNKSKARAQLKAGR